MKNILQKKLFLKIYFSFHLFITCDVTDISAQKMQNSTRNISQFIAGRADNIVDPIKRPMQR
jgi:hypothetical protein